MSPSQIRFHLTAAGSAYHRDLADLVAAGLRSIGQDTTVVEDGPALAPDEGLDVIVAPHEHLTIGLHHVGLDEVTNWVRGAGLLLTEGPERPEWDLQVHFSRSSPMVLAATPQIHGALEDAGVASHLVPLGHHPLLESGDLATGERTVDVSVLGAADGRRHQVLGALGTTLAGRRSELLLFDPLVPPSAQDEHFVAGRARADQMARSAIVLHVHRDDAKGFAWSTALAAIANEAVFICEPSVGFEPLEPFVHFLPLEIDEIPDYLDAFAVEPTSRTDFALAAKESLVKGHALEDRLARDLLPVLTEALSATRTSAPPLPVQRLARPPSPWPTTDPGTTQDTIRRLGTDLKACRSANQVLRRERDELAVVQSGRDPSEIREFATPAWESAGRLDITAIVPLFDQGSYVTEAIDSVFSQVPDETSSDDPTPRTGVIVIDDASTDDSVEVVRRYLEDHPDRPVKLLSRSLNAGPSAARSLGVSAAPSDHVLLLDADNRLLPGALATMHGLLRASDDPTAAFAYGALRVFGDDTSLLSAMPWSVDSLVRRPYIDNLVMLRTDAWEAVGGFPDDSEGLEDYAFFVQLAAHGYRGLWTSTIVAEYRSHDAARSRTVSLDMTAPQRDLQARFPELPWPHVDAGSPGHPAAPGDASPPPDGHDGGRPRPRSDR